MAAPTSGTGFIPRPKKSRPGVYSKNKAGRNKGSKNYLKRYRGQGR